MDIKDLCVHDAVQMKWPDTTWPYVTEQIKTKFHTSQGKTLFINAVEDIFFFDVRGFNKKFSPAPEIFQSYDSWVGVSHQHRQFLSDEKHDWSYFEQSMHRCKCLITLSQYMKEYWLDKFPDLNVVNLLHPVPKRQHVFDLDKFRNNKVIRCIGTWGRDYKIWNQLETIYDKQSSRDNYLPREQFDLTFVDTINFLDVQDASANNAVIECIQRNTPILVRKHPAVIEYLGDDYPLYFESLEHANMLINNIDHIIAAHKYLQQMNKHHIQIETFLHDFSEIN